MRHEHNMPGEQGPRTWLDFRLLFIIGVVFLVVWVATNNIAFLGVATAVLLGTCLSFKPQADQMNGRKPSEDERLG